MIVVHLQDPEQWRRLLDEAQRLGAAQLPLGGAQPRALTEEVVSFEVAGERFARARGRVVHLMGDSAAVSFEPAEVRRLAELSFPTAAPEPAPEPTPAPTSEPPSSPRASGGEAPLWSRYAELAKVEKVHLARKGGADARRLIFKDRDRQLQGYVLNNPGLRANELATLLKLSPPDRELIKRVLAIQQFSHHHGVCEALVRNPQTPIKVAVDLVPRLSDMSVRRIAKQGSLRPEIVAAARRRVVRRR